MQRPAVPLRSRAGQWPGTRNTDTRSCHYPPPINAELIELGFQLPPKRLVQQHLEHMLRLALNFTLPSPRRALQGVLLLAFPPSGAAIRLPKDVLAPGVVAVTNNQARVVIQTGGENSVYGPKGGWTSPMERVPIVIKRLNVQSLILLSKFQDELMAGESRGHLLDDSRVVSFECRKVVSGHVLPPKTI